MLTLSVTAIAGKVEHEKLNHDNLTFHSQFLGDKIIVISLIKFSCGYRKREEVIG